MDHLEEPAPRIPPPARRRTSPFADGLVWKSALEQRRHAGNDQRRVLRVPCSVLRQGNKSLEAFTDYISMRQPGFVWENFPRRIEERVKPGRLLARNFGLLDLRSAFDEGGWTS